MTNNQMKKSNLIVIAALGVLFLLTISFQLTVHNHIKKGEVKKVGVFISQDRNLEAFSKLEVTGNIKVLFAQDSLSLLKIEAPENAIDSIKTTVKNGKLGISKGIKISEKDTIRVFVTNPQLEELTVASGARFKGTTVISGKKLNLKITGKSKVNINLSYNLINCQKSQKSILDLEGDTKKINFSTTE